MRWYGSNSSSKQVVRTQLWRRVATQLRAQQFRKLLVIHRVGTLVDYLSKHQTPSECHNWWIAKDASITFHNQIPIVYSYYRDVVWWPPHLAQQIMFLAKHAQKIEPLYIYQQVCVSKISGGRGNGAILLDIMMLDNMLLAGWQHLLWLTLYNNWDSWVRMKQYTAGSYFPAKLLHSKVLF